ncbi:MAG: PHP domain-containing protein [Tissierellia bacterium]|nr:PHP domain-containing protein [Tissierellia bacterium]
MLIDMHMHESTYSSDSFLKLDEMVYRARELGLDGICITDHESNEIREFAKAYSKQVNFPIFVGFEYLTDSGDIITFGVKNVPKEIKMPLNDYLDYVKSEGGISLAAHPYRKNFRGLEDKLKTAPLDGIEAFNGSTPMDLNQMAFNVAKDRKIHATGASDCHVYKKIGVYATHIPDGIENEEDLVLAFKNPSSNIYPVAFNNGKYINLTSDEALDFEYAI